MKRKWIRCLWVLAAMVLMLSACALSEEDEKQSDALTWGTWNSYARHEKFLQLLEETYPEIELEFISYTGGNQTGYSWAQMRADDIPDIFITSQILDGELAKERLVDLSGYSFVSAFPTIILDQVSVDGGVYLLPLGSKMYGILYNKTLMEEHGWEIPSNFAELEALCAQIREAGLIPGIMSTRLTGHTFSAVFNLAKTDWLTTFEGGQWEKDFLAGNVAAAGRWEGTMDYAQRYLDIGMFYTDPEDLGNTDLLMKYLGERKAVFYTGAYAPSITEFPETGDKLGMMPYIGEDGSKNIYMYSPDAYFGISSRLLEPGNEKKLENAIQLLSLMYSEEGQEALIGESMPTAMKVPDTGNVTEDSIIYDARQAMEEGRAFPMTYAGWEDILADIGQAIKDWFRGENDMDGAKCIARMDELQRNYLNHSEEQDFCEATADFTLEETAKLLGKVLGSNVETDAVLVPIGEFHEGGIEIKAGVTGKLYQGKINSDVVSTICPSYDSEYAVMTMTGTQMKELAAAGFDAAGDGNPFPYLLVMKGNVEPEEDGTYRVAFFAQGYTEEIAQAYSAEICPGSMRTFLRAWLEEQRVVSPDRNPWE